MIDKLIEQMEQTREENKKLFRYYVFLEREAHRKGEHEEKSYWLERVCDIEEEIDRLDADIQKLRGES